MPQTIPKRRGRAGGDNGIDNASDTTTVMLVKKKGNREKTVNTMFLIISNPFTSARKL